LKKECGGGGQKCETDVKNIVVYNKTEKRVKTNRVIFHLPIN
jgi:hypothetical protein